MSPNALILARKASRAVRRLTGREGPAISDSYERIDRAQSISRHSDAWLDATVAQRQQDAYRPLLAELRAGRPRIDFVAAAQAVNAAGPGIQSLLEVGCGSGYYQEVFAALVPFSLAYTGIDLGFPMIALAKQSCPAGRYLVADAVSLPFPENSFDLVLNGVSLMHVLEFTEAVRESVRVSRGWCVFHTVPVQESLPTCYLRKRAYGESTIEIIFNRAEIEAEFSQSGLRIQQVSPSIDYDLRQVLGTPTYTLTYLCRREGC